MSNVGRFVNLTAVTLPWLTEEYLCWRLDFAIVAEALLKSLQFFVLGNFKIIKSTHKSISIFPIKWRHVFVLLGLALLVGMVFGNSFRSGFVLDSEAIIKNDPRLKAANWDNIRLILTEDYWYTSGVSGLYRPVTTMSFLFDYSICEYGNNPTNYHRINLAFHMLNAFLVYLLLLQFNFHVWRSIAAAGIFAVHPIATESVTNLVGRADLFSAASVLVGTLTYILGTKTNGKHRWFWLSLMSITVALGVLAKENAVVIAALIPVYEIVYRYPKDRVGRANAFRFIWQWMLQGYILVVAILSVLFLIRSWIVYQSGPPMISWIDNPLFATDFVSARLTAITVIGHYLWLLVFPVHLSSDYSYIAIPFSTWRMSKLNDWMAIATLLLMFTLGLYFWKRYRQSAKAELYFGLWFIIALLPTSNLIILIGSNMAERFLYLPLVGFASLAVLMIDSIVSRFHRFAWGITMVLIITILGTRTYIRNMDWETQLSIWSSAVKVCPQSLRANQALALAIYKSDEVTPEFDRIILLAQNAVNLAKSLPMEECNVATYTNIANFMSMKADRLAARGVQDSWVITDESRKLYEQSLLYLEQAKRVGEAACAKRIKSLMANGWDKEEIGELGPESVYQNSALIYARLDQNEEAEKALRRLQVINPNSSAVYQYLPTILLKKGDIHEACVVLVQSLLLGYQNDLAMQQLLMAYSQLNTHSMPAVTQQGSHMNFVFENPLVRSDLERACAELIELSLRDKDLDTAKRVLGISKRIGLPSTNLDELFIQFGPKNRPWRTLR